MAFYYLGIDPSAEHTGLVAVAEDGHVIGCMTCPITELVQSWHELQTLYGLGSPARIVIERPPQAPGKMSESAMQTIGAYWHARWTLRARHGDVGPDGGALIRSVGPGTWKPAAKGWGIVYPPVLTDQHMRDAYAMLIVTMRGDIPFERKAGD